MALCFQKITNLYCICIWLPAACIRRCVKQFILLAEIQGKWQKEIYSTVQNIGGENLFSDWLVFQH